jgi:hypothetical protein
MKKKIDYKKETKKLAMLLRLLWRTKNINMGVGTV